MHWFISMALVGFLVCAKLGHTQEPSIDGTESRFGSIDGPLPAAPVQSYEHSHLADDHSPYPSNEASRHEVRRLGGIGLIERGNFLPGFPLKQQPDQISCGPTAASMVLQYYGISAGIGPLKTACNTRWLSLGKYHVGMTFPGELARGMASYGVSASTYRADLNELVRVINSRKPAIVLVRSGVDTWHYVVVIGYQNNGDRFKIADPGSGQSYCIRGDQLNGAWRFSHDLNGNRTTGAKCNGCNGGGKLWTKCGVCSGTGKLSAGVLGWTKCNACSGRGKWSSNCPLCSGDGTLTDWYRKVVETAGVQGHTLIVPHRTAQLPPAQPGDEVCPETYSLRCIWNYTNQSLNYSAKWGKGKWEPFSIAANSWRYHAWNISDNQGSPEFFVEFDYDLNSNVDSRKSYRLNGWRAYTTNCAQIHQREIFNYSNPQRTLIDIFSQK